LTVALFYFVFFSHPQVFLLFKQQQQQQQQQQHPEQGM